jgi:metal-dependent amidase/aminoacylase/carboxypeptidase family protein
MDEVYALRELRKYLKKRMEDLINGYKTVSAAEFERHRARYMEAEAINDQLTKILRTTKTEVETDVEEAD